MPLSGEIQELLNTIRFYVDDPALAARYTDARLVPLLKSSFRAILRDIMLVSSQPPIGRYSFTTVADQAVYPLPLYSELLQIAQISDITGLVNWDVRPQSFWNPLGPGYLLEGTRQIRFVPTPRTGGDTVTMSFVPSGDGEFFRGEIRAEFCTTTTIRLASNAFGALSTDPLAFVGHFINVFEATGDFWPAEVRQITAWDIPTRTVTVAPAFTTDPTGLQGGALLQMEITPDLLRPHKQLLALHVAKFITGMEKRGRGFASLNRLYNDEKRAIMLIAANAEGRAGQHWAADTRDNSDYWFGT
ncbi:hypothetical protein LCGC14_0564850 [marine sediment metagenome]|uniref:Uncharacterized protein n=1 Tax=marine sediment metagenome TaxID=412755 RepID=A0A0F9S4G5_9ZZZZ